MVFEDHDAFWDSGLVKRAGEFTQRSLNERPLAKLSPHPMAPEQTGSAPIKVARRSRHSNEASCNKFLLD
jgi:hypothetical protein